MKACVYLLICTLPALADSGMLQRLHETVPGLAGSAGDLYIGTGNGLVRMPERSIP